MLGKVLKSSGSRSRVAEFCASCSAFESLINPSVVGLFFNLVDPDGRREARPRLHLTKASQFRHRLFCSRSEMVVIGMLHEGRTAHETFSDSTTGTTF